MQVPSIIPSVIIRYTCSQTIYEYMISPVDAAGYKGAQGVPGVCAECAHGLLYGVHMCQSEGKPASGPVWGFSSPDSFGVQMATVWGMVSKQLRGMRWFLDFQSLGTSLQLKANRPEVISCRYTSGRYCWLLAREALEVQLEELAFLCDRLQALLYKVLRVKNPVLKSFSPQVPPPFPERAA